MDAAKPPANAHDLNAAEAPQRFWARPEQYLLDAGKDGEQLIAKIPVALTFVLLLVPLADIISAANEGREQHFIGFFVTAAAVLLSSASPRGTKYRHRRLPNSSPRPTRDCTRRKRRGGIAWWVRR
jgi:hypothetical protein